MKLLLIAATAALGIALAALALAAGLRPADPAAAQFVLGLGYFGLMLAPVSALALLVVGSLALVRTARGDAAANAAALRATGRG